MMLYHHQFVVMKNKLRWKNSAPTSFKCNVDATLFSHQCNYEIEMYIRNEKSHFF
jgi:hypothetical protein